MPERERFRRGIYLLPSLFTVGNMFCGFYSIVLAISGDFHHGGLLLGVAILLDGLDGKIARLTHTTSEFGVQLDSLCDVISFGVAPAVLAYTWGLRSTGRAGWLIAFIYIVSGASRLARFNVQTSVIESMDFVGLPIPAGAAIIAAVVFAFSEPPTEAPWVLGALALMGTVALLQVSTIRYPSFKRLDLTSRRPYMYVVLIASIFALIAYDPPVTLLLLASLYLVSGPIGKVLFKRGFKEAVADVTPMPAPLPAEKRASGS